METLFRQLEERGYPAAPVAWLRRRRLLAIVFFALVSWMIFIAVFAGIYAVGKLIAALVAGPV